VVWNSVSPNHNFGIRLHVSNTTNAPYAAPRYTRNHSASTHQPPTHTTDKVMAEQSINIPQVIVFIVVTFLAVRWYLSKPTAVAPGTQAAANRAASRVSPAQIDQVAEMLPQFSRRDIAWDLQRNGGNVAATTERALSGRGLDTVRLTLETLSCHRHMLTYRQAPASFQIPTPAPRTAPAPTRAAPTPARPAHPDLITRYNLSSKLSQVSQPTQEEQPKAKSWSADKSERQANLQRRREEMILAARRKLEEQEKAKASGAA
jgi:coupling of ubiquitin conjugation to ER degradation protein 1